MKAACLLGSALVVIASVSIGNNAHAEDAVSVLKHARTAYVQLRSLKETWTTNSWFLGCKTSFKTTLAVSGSRSRYETVPNPRVLGPAGLAGGLFYLSANYAAPAVKAYDGTAVTLAIGDAYYTTQIKYPSPPVDTQFAHLPDQNAHVTLLPGTTLAGRPMYVLSWSEPVGEIGTMQFHLYIDRASYLMQRNEVDVFVNPDISWRSVDALVARTQNAPIPARLLRFTPQPGNREFGDFSQFGTWLDLQRTPLPPAHTVKSGYFTTHEDPLHLRIHYTDFGKGEPLVLIRHCLGDDQNRLSGLLQSTLKCRIITLDCRGQGESDRSINPNEYGQEMVNDVVRLLDRLHLRKAWIIGAGMGSLVASNLLITHPDRVKSAILCGGPPITVPLFRHYGSFEELLSHTLDALDEHNSLLADWWSPSSKRMRLAMKISAGKLEMDNLGSSDHTDARALAATFRALPALAVEERQLAANKVATLAILGSDDPVKADIRYLKAHMPHLEAMQVPDNLWQTGLGWEGFPSCVQMFLSQHDR